MKKILTILSVCLILSSSYIFSFRGRWAAAGVGYAAGKSSSNRSNPNQATDRQIKRHESEIENHKKEIAKINKDKRLTSEDKQKKIKYHESEIEKIENYIKNLL